MSSISRSSALASSTRSWCMSGAPSIATTRSCKKRCTRWLRFVKTATWQRNIANGPLNSVYPIAISVLGTSRIAGITRREQMETPPKGERSPLSIQGLPDWITPELIAETLDVWQPHYDKQLTDGDAIEILQGDAALLDANG